MSKASELWDLLHEAAPFIPVAQVDLHERIQAALDEGAEPQEDFDTCTTFWQITEWDGIQRKFQILKRRCGKAEAEKLYEQYRYAGRKVSITEVSQYETEVKPEGSTDA